VGRSFEVASSLPDSLPYLHMIAMYIINGTPLKYNCYLHDAHEATLVTKAPSNDTRWEVDTKSTYYRMQYGLHCRIFYRYIQIY